LSIKIVLAIEDGTSHSLLKPLADDLSSWADVELLLLDSFFEADERDISISKDELEYPYRDVSDYIRHDLFKSPPNSWTTPRAIGQRILLDNVSPQIAFDIDGFLYESDADVFVSGVDQFPFIRHVLHRAPDNVITAVIQQGTYEYALNPKNLTGRTFFPDLDSPNRVTERVKRQLGFRYGVTQFCHQYADFAFTMGSFFTETINGYRKLYNRDETEIVTSGTPEFDGPVSDYEPEQESILFLSQQKYESGDWSWEDHEKTIDVLRSISGNIPVTVRPHPKDSERKIRSFERSFEVTRRTTLQEDVADNDIVLTPDSTAIFEGVIQGKTCGILQLPWCESDFEPFTHDHMVQVVDSSTGLLGTTKSVDSQRDYLDKFCRMPGEDRITDASSSCELISDRIRASVTK